MPQMSPMMWLVLSFFNLLNMFLLMFYLNSMPIYLKINNNDMLNEKINNYLKWNWMW